MAKVNKWEGPYTTVPNSLAFDKKLSWRAKGIFLYMQAKPVNWDFDSIRMSEDSTDGKDSTREGIKELVNQGFLRRKKLSTGKMEYELIEPMAEIPTEGKTHRGKIRPILNKDSYKEIKKEHMGEASSPFVWDEYLSEMRKSKDRRIKIIGAFFKIKGVTFSSQEQVQSAIRRHLKAAKELVAFEDGKIIDTMKKLNYDFPKFTIETTHKELTK